MGHCHRVMGDAWSWALASPLRFKQLEACIAAGQEPSFHRCEPVEDNLMEFLSATGASFSLVLPLHRVQPLSCLPLSFFRGGGGEFFF